MAKTTDDTAETMMMAKVPADIRAAMEAKQTRDGMAFAEQIRRALRMYLTAEGVLTAGK